MDDSTIQFLKLIGQFIAVVGTIVAAMIGVAKMTVAQANRQNTQTLTALVDQNKVLIESVTETQERIQASVENHLSTISQYMGKQTAMMETMQGRLLDAALRKEEVVK